MDDPRAPRPTDAVARERVAVIAIHGVADQKPGDTARAIASLLIHAGGADAHYSAGACDSVILAVPALNAMARGPAPGPDPARPEPAATAPPTAAPAARPLGNALRESCRSDFQRHGWVTTSPAPDPAGARAAPEPAPAPADAGIAFSDYLLFKADRNADEHGAYEATRVRMTRTSAAGARQAVDMHEMYWADLSRLSGALPRIVTELFTMVFRLSRLGRDTVDQAGRAARDDVAARPDAARTWSRLTAVQIGLDWAFSTILATLFLQLLLVGLTIAALGFAIPRTRTFHAVLAWVLPALVAWWVCYRHAHSDWGRVVCVAAALGAVSLLLLVPAHWVVGLTCLAVLALLCDAGLRVADARFPAVRAAGLALLAATLLALLAHVVAATAAAGRDGDLHDWLRAAMRVVEYLLLGVVAWWAATALPLLAWFVLGERAARQSASARASVATGRLGLFVSIASFLALTMAIWALVTTLVEPGAAGTTYCPLIFVRAECSDALTGAMFLHDRYEKSTEAFALVAGLTLLLVAYLAVIFVPSVLAEVRASVGTSQTLGRWLSAGYRRLDTVVQVLVVASVLMAFSVGVLLLMARFGVAPGGWVGELSERVALLSKTVLKPLVLSAATAAAAMTAFGHLLSRYAPWLRAPLDVALDVDNHFREFPRRAIPRALIFARYVALLEHVVAQGCDRVVIVSHSQGTVISTELLRYLQHRGRRAAAAGDDPRFAALWARLDGRIDLLTAGCPLRQLYAARFPTLYEWVLRVRETRSGPAAADVGVRRWINVYTTGDYVGRWLWCDAPPAVDTVVGRATLYDPDGHQVSDVAAERDVCLGSGAHTHYFEPSQKVVARWIDALVAG